MNNLHKYKNYTLTQRYCLYKILGLDLVCQVLIDLMSEKQLELISKIEFSSGESNQKTKSFINKLWSKNV